MTEGQRSSGREMLRVTGGIGGHEPVTGPRGRETVVVGLIPTN